jgi:alpha(1,3/1,4) fucosyltransferase
MKKIKLGFADTHEHLSLFFSSLLANRFDVEIDNDNPDYLIFGDDNFGTSNKKFDKKDVVKIFYTGENRRPEDYDCHYAITFDHNYSPWHFRMPLFVIYMWALQNIHNLEYDYYHILGEHTPKPKTDFCSFVVSNPNCNERNQFFEKLNAIKRVDSGGRVFNNIGKSLDGEQAKLDFLSTRKFNICFESGSHPGYITEKILHSYYAGTVPIYWGSTTAASDFNAQSMVNVHDFESFDKAIEYVMLLDNNDDLYNRVLSAPKLADNIPRDYMLLNNFLNWFDAIVYNKLSAKE